mgnify:CR=1 FL=1
MLASPPEDYLKTVASVLAESLNATIGESFASAVMTVRSATDEEFGSEEVTYHGTLYDCMFKKELGPSMTVHMELRQR